MPGILLDRVENFKECLPRWLEGRRRRVPMNCLVIIGLHLLNFLFYANRFACVKFEILCLWNLKVKLKKECVFDLLAFSTVGYSVISRAKKHQKLFSVSNRCFVFRQRVKIHLRKVTLCFNRKNSWKNRNFSFVGPVNLLARLGWQSQNKSTTAGQIRVSKLLFTLIQNKCHLNLIFDAKSKADRKHFDCVAFVEFAGDFINGCPN